MSLGDFSIIGNSGAVDIKPPLIEYLSTPTESVLRKKLTRTVRILSSSVQSFYQSVTSLNANLTLTTTNASGALTTTSYGSGWTLTDSSASHIGNGIFSELRLEFEKDVNNIFEFNLPTGLSVYVDGTTGYFKYNDTVLLSFTSGRGGEWVLDNAFIGSFKFLNVFHENSIGFYSELNSSGQFTYKYRNFYSQIEEILTHTLYCCDTIVSTHTDSIDRFVTTKTNIKVTYTDINEPNITLESLKQKLEATDGIISAENLQEISRDTVYTVTVSVDLTYYDLQKWIASYNNGCYGFIVDGDMLYLVYGAARGSQLNGALIIMHWNVGGL